jgi:uncharacterized protein
MNPFILYDYAGPDYFCDREQETSRIINAVENQRNLTLGSLRKMGKTGLIHHVFHHYNSLKSANCIYIDVYSTDTLSDFINRFATGVLESSGRFSGKLRRKISNFIARIRPTITYDPFTGSQTFSFYLTNASDTTRTLEDIFDFLNEGSLDLPVIIAIDEFQKVADYPEANTEALLRGYIQKLNNISFIFSGSDQRLLGSMFSDANRPFYQSTEFMHLEEIPADQYTRFIIDKFGDQEKNIEEEAIHEILQLTRGHTYYVQFVCNKLYGSGHRIIDKVTVLKQFGTILKENEAWFEEYKNLITKHQWNLLLAIAREENPEQVTSSSFIRKYNLSNASTIRRGIDSLLQKNLLYKKGDVYFVYDVFFSAWLRRGMTN